MVRVKVAQCSERGHMAKQTAAYYVSTGSTSLPMSVTVQLGPICWQN